MVTYGTVNLYSAQEHCLLMNICASHLRSLSRERKEQGSEGEEILTLTNKDR